MKFSIKEILKDEEEMKIINESVNIGKYQSLTEAFIGKFNSEREFEKAIFISHKTTQKYYANLLAKKLDKRNYDVYLDTEDIGLSALFESVDNHDIMNFLKYGIKNSDYFFCILSNDVEKNSDFGAYYSDNWIEDEYNYAYEESKNIWGLKLENYKKTNPSFWKTHDIDFDYEPPIEFYKNITSFDEFINNYNKVLPLGKKRMSSIFEVLLNA